MPLGGGGCRTECQGTPSLVTKPSLCVVANTSSYE
jgi:hypothetical protein